MCRHLGYLGAPVPMADPLVRAPHSLSVQSHAPRDMRHGGTVNADGFGLGWFADDGRPVRYRRANPIWTDGSLPRLAETLRVGRFVAAVRSGTPGMPVTESACAPFADDDWLFSHNGVVHGWPDSVAGLAEEVPVTELVRLEAPTDSALLWALLRRRLRAGADPADAVARLTGEVERAAPGSRLNLLLVGTEVLVATAWTHALAIRRVPEGVYVASEPWDDAPEWEQVADGGLVVARQWQPGSGAASPDGGVHVEVADLGERMESA